MADESSREQVGTDSTQSNKYKYKNKSDQNNMIKYKKNFCLS